MQGFTARGQRVTSPTVTLERRPKPAEPADQRSDTEADQIRAVNEEARQDVADRAAELLKRLRQL